MKTEAVDLTNALTAAADALEMDLEMGLHKPYTILGEGNQKLHLMGQIKDFDYPVVDSVVDAARSIITLLVRISGNLHAVLISDDQNQKLQLFLIDGSKVSIKNLLPAFWNREKLYKNILPGLKASYGKNFYDKKWTLVEKGKVWMEKYLERKHAESERRKYR